MSSKKVYSLVAGGCGYFGHELVKALINEGHTVSVFDLQAPSNPISGVTYFIGNVLDQAALNEALQNVDILFHSIAKVPLSRNDKLFRTVNIHGTDNLLKAAKINGVKKFVYTSSSAVYGIPKKNPVLEMDATIPIESYGRAKLEGEKICLEYVKNGLDVTIIRPRTIIGGGRLGIFGILFKWVSQGLNLFVFDGGNNVYQFVDVRDLATAEIAASKEIGPQIYNVGSEKFGTMKQTLQSLADHAKTGSIVVSLPKRIVSQPMKFLSKIRLAPFAEYHWKMYSESLYFDCSKIQNRLGWSAEYSVSQSIIDSYENYLANKESSFTGSDHQTVPKEGVINFSNKLLTFLSKIINRRTNTFY